MHNRELDCMCEREKEDKEGGVQRERGTERGERERESERERRGERRRVGEREGERLTHEHNVC